MLKRLSVMKLIFVMGTVSRKMKNIIATNVTKNCYCKKARYKFDSYNLDIVLLVAILLIIITKKH